MECILSQQENSTWKSIFKWLLCIDYYFAASSVSGFYICSRCNFLFWIYSDQEQGQELYVSEFVYSKLKHLFPVWSKDTVAWDTMIIVYNTSRKNNPLNSTLCLKACLFPVSQAKRREAASLPSHVCPILETIHCVHRFLWELLKSNLIFQFRSGTRQRY